jgi:hypothetical protein
MKEKPVWNIGGLLGSGNAEVLERKKYILQCHFIHHKSPTDILASALRQHVS